MQIKNLRSIDLEELDKYREEKNDFVIFGAGSHGYIASNALESLKINVKYIFDNSKQRIGKQIKNIEIVRPNNKSVNLDMPVLIASVYPEAMYDQLINLGFKNIFLCDLLYDYYLSKTPTFVHEESGILKSTQDIKREVDLYNLEIRRFKFQATNNNLEIKSLDLVVTERCTLKCQDCSNLMQYYTRPKNADMDNLINSLTNLLDNVDRINEYRIIGGEPFIHRELDKLLSFLMETKNFLRIVVYTNATIMPKDSTLNLLKDLNAFIDISNYGDLSRNFKCLTKELEKKNIDYSAKELKWTDSGRILEKPHSSQDYVKKLFKNCCTRDVFTIMHGKLYHCPFSANLAELIDYKNKDRDFINLISEKEKINREKLSNFFFNKSYLEACFLCNGRDYSTPYIPVAKQTQKPLNIPKFN